MKPVICSGDLSWDPLQPPHLSSKAKGATTAWKFFPSHFFQRHKNLNIPYLFNKSERKRKERESEREKEREVNACQKFRVSIKKKKIPKVLKFSHSTSGNCLKDNDNNNYNYLL